MKRIVLIQSIIIAALVFLVIILVSNHSRPSGGSGTAKYPLLSDGISKRTFRDHSHLLINLGPLRDQLQDYISSQNANISVYVLNLEDGVSMELRAGDKISPASLNKLPIAIIILQKIETGQLSMDTQIPITPENLNAGSGNIYKKGYTSLSIGELLYYMLSESDNTATLTLISQIDVREIRELSNYLGYYQSDINIANQGSNVFQVTPRSMANLFISLYRSTLLNASDSELLLSLLTNTSFDIRKYADIPDTVPIAQKYGSYHQNGTDLFHNCGIIYARNSDVFYCVMTKGMDEKKSPQIVGKIVHDIYQYIESDVGKYTILNAG